MSDSDEGFSLIEVVVAIVVVGLTVSAMLTALLTAVNTSDTHRSLAIADNALRNYAEEIRRAVRTQCASGTTGGTFTPVFAAPAGYAVSPSPVATSCPSGVGADSWRTIQITASGGTPSVSKQLTIAIRRP